MLPSSSGPQQPRVHAPVRADVRDFLQQQLYGDRLRRVPAATLSSMKASGGRFGAASNFASVPLAPPAQPAGGKKRGKRKRGAAAPTGRSTLEQMAAKIMRRKAL